MENIPCMLKSLDQHTYIILLFVIGSKNDKQDYKIIDDDMFNIGDFLIFRIIHFSNHLLLKSTQRMSSFVLSVCGGLRRIYPAVKGTYRLEQVSGLRSPVFPKRSGGAGVNSDGAWQIQYHSFDTELGTPT